MRRIFIFGILAFMTVATAYANALYPNATLGRVAWTLAVFAGLYLLFRVGLEKIGSKRISNTKTRYTYRKSLGAIFYGVFVLAVVRIWIEDPQALIVTYGVVGAGIAIALQDVFKNLAGGMLLILSRPYAVGDRVEIDGTAGDVINIGAFSTTLMEIGEWVAGDQSTGRLVDMPNGRLLTVPIKNFTRGHDFLWDEIFVPVTFESDWKEAMTLIRDIVGRRTSLEAARASETISKLQERYYLSARETDPAVFMRMTDNWVDLRVRYVTEARERRKMRSELSVEILEAIQARPDIELASETLKVLK